MQDLFSDIVLEKTASVEKMKLHNKYYRMGSSMRIKQKIKKDKHQHDYFVLDESCMMQKHNSSHILSRTSGFVLTLLAPPSEMLSDFSGHEAVITSTNSGICFSKKISMIFALCYNWNALEK